MLDVPQDERCLPSSSPAARAEEPLRTQNVGRGSVVCVPSASSSPQDEGFTALACRTQKRETPFVP